MKDYQDLHLKCDVLFLTDVLGKFIKIRLTNCGLCPSHYLSSPALIWDEILNMTKVDLEFISDADIYLFFERCMKDVVSYISKSYSKSNNKYLKSLA